MCVLKDCNAKIADYCIRTSISLRLVKGVFLHCSEIRRDKIRRSRRSDATNRADEETPCNVNERDCKHRNDRRQLCFALILVRMYVTRVHELHSRIAESFLSDSHTKEVSTFIISVNSFP